MVSVEFNIYDQLKYIKSIIMSASKKKIICYGAGQIFPEFIKRCCVDNKLLPMPAYVCDGNPALHGKLKCGVPIEPPEKIKNENPNSVLIIITGAYVEVAGFLNKSMNCYYFPMIPQICFEVYLAFKDRIDDAKKITSELSDEPSKYYYNAVIKNLLRGSIFMPHLFTENQYYGNDVLINLSNDGSLVFCGAYDGKHITRAIEINKQIKVHAFEPNEKYALLLKEEYSNNENIHVHAKAAYDKNTQLFFDNSKDLDARIANTAHDSEGNSFESILAVKLDDVINEKVNMIAMDVEGAEHEAIMGAKNIIEKYKPALAICSYHKAEDYLTLPELIKKINPDYKLYFRHHSSVHCESVFYAI